MNGYITRADAMQSIVRTYIADHNDCHDWADKAELHRELSMIGRELNMIAKAVSKLESYGLKVS